METSRFYLNLSFADSKTTFAQENKNNRKLENENSNLHIFAIILAKVMTFTGCTFFPNSKKISIFWNVTNLKIQVIELFLQRIETLVYLQISRLTLL